MAHFSAITWLQQREGKSELSKLEFTTLWHIHNPSSNYTRRNVDCRKCWGLPGASSFLCKSLQQFYSPHWNGNAIAMDLMIPLPSSVLLSFTRLLPQHIAKKAMEISTWLGGNTESATVWESENRAGHKPVLHFPFSSLAEGFAQLLVNAEQLRVCSIQWLCWRQLWMSESPGDSALSQ